MNHALRAIQGLAPIRDCVRFERLISCRQQQLLTVGWLSGLHARAVRCRTFPRQFPRTALDRCVTLLPYHR